jgi:predicted MFS family arabinose efflux permease
MDWKRMERILFQQNGLLAWIVCLGMFFTNMIVQGINNAFGEIISSIEKEFDSDLAAVAVITSLHSAAYYFAGFIGSILFKWYSFRTLVFVSGVGSCIAYLASYYAQSITSLAISFGLFGGMVNGLVYVTGLVSCGFYFDDTKRALATGIATSGSGVGIVIIPLMVSYISENSGWRNSMLFLSSISPIICLVALIMVPLSTTPGDMDVELNKHTQASSCEMDKTNSIVPDPAKTEVEGKNRMNFWEINFDFKVSKFLEQIKQYFIHSWSLLGHPKLLQYCLSQGLFTLAYFIPIDFLSSMMVEDHGISVRQAGFIIPVFGVAACIGKLLTGFLITRFTLDPLQLHAICLIGSGFFCFMFTVCSQYSHFIGVAIFYGLVVGPICTMMNECLTKMYGKELIKTTVGFVMLMYSIAAGIGPPFGGWFHDISDNFNGPFYFSSATYFVAAFFGCCALHFNKEYEPM